jgi:hypothetical protein
MILALKSFYFFIVLCGSLWLLATTLCKFFKFLSSSRRFLLIIFIHKLTILHSSLIKFLSKLHSHLHGLVVESFTSMLIK